MVLRPDKEHSLILIWRHADLSLALFSDNWQLSTERLKSLPKRHYQHKSDEEWYRTDQKPKHGPIGFSGSNRSEQQERPGKTKNAHILTHPIVPW
jgi:hypothetical protein